MASLWISLVPTLLFALITWKIVNFVLRLRYWNNICKNIPPLGKRHPIYGHMQHFPDVKSYLVYFNKIMSETKGKIFHAWMLCFYPAFYVCHPDTAKILLKSSEPKPTKFGQSYRHFIPWLGDGLLISEGAKWERNRKLLTPAFHFNILIPYVKIYNEVVDVLMDRITEEGKQREYIEICDLVGMATLDTMLRCAFSYKGNVQLRGENHPYVKAIRRLPGICLERTLKPFLFSDFVFYNTALGKEFVNHTNYVHKFAMDVIGARRGSLEREKSELNKRYLDFLDILLTATDETGTGLTDEEIRAEVDTFLFEGHDTTASGIHWAIYSLAKFPEEQDKVFREVSDVVSEKYVKWEDLSKFYYLSLFIKEVMRMYSPVPLISRRLTRPYVYEDIEIPASVSMDINLICLHHHPDVYPDHEVFRPERFRDIDDKDPYAFVPFSAGPRNCIGQNFALNEIKVFLARLLIRYQIILDRDNEIEIIPESTLKSKNGIKVKFVPREAEE